MSTVAVPSKTKKASTKKTQLDTVPEVDESKVVARKPMTATVAEVEKKAQAEKAKRDAEEKRKAEESATAVAANEASNEARATLRQKLDDHKLLTTDEMLRGEKIAHEPVPLNTPCEFMLHESMVFFLREDAEKVVDLLLELKKCYEEYLDLEASAEKKTVIEVEDVSEPDDLLPRFRPITSFAQIMEQDRKAKESDPTAVFFKLYRDLDQIFCKNDNKAKACCYFDLTCGTRVFKAMSLHVDKAIRTGRYRTAMCKNFVEHGKCPYRECLFAHGEDQLQTADSQDIHVNYCFCGSNVHIAEHANSEHGSDDKSKGGKHCNKYHTTGCPYGDRCHYIHDPTYRFPRCKNGTTCTIDGCPFKHEEPTPKKAFTPREQMPVCIHYTKGTCQYGDKCKYNHPPVASAKSDLAKMSSSSTAKPVKSTKKVTEETAESTS